jgi:flagellar capping protein FliD
MSTNLISGLSSGFDWRSMIDQLISIERKRVDIVSTKKTNQEKKLTEWQSFNTKLLALKTAASNLNSPTDFNVFKAAMTTDSSTVKASDLLSVTTAATASVGSYTLKVNNKATAQKLSSASFTTASEALGAGYEGDILINGKVITITAVDTLISLRAKINNANSGANPTGVTAGLVSYEAGDHRLVLTNDATGAAEIGLLNGGATDILNLLGFTDSEGGFSDVAGVTGDIANKSAGVVISTATLIKDIDGYTGYADTDYIRLEGTDSSGNPVSDDTFVLSDTTTVGDLLSRIQSVFGDVTTSITSEGKLRVVDNTSGASYLAIKIGIKNSGGADDGTLKFDADGDLGNAVTIRKRQLIAGTDASITIDGVTVTRSTNTIDDILTGVTLDLLKADAGTTVTLNVGRDIDALMEKINTFVTSYNNIASYIRTQSSYDGTKQQSGGLLFADGTLASVKSDLTSILVRKVWGVSSDFSTLGMVGVSVSREGQLAIDDSKLRGCLTANFNDVQKLFTASGTASTGTLAYISHGIDTKEGEYTVHIDQAAGNGVDVSGTINGEVATGRGQILTGSSGEANVDGLVVKYTGSTGSVDAGTVMLTFGVAELFDRALLHITDSIDGYVSFKQQSIQNSIKGFQTQMDEMEARLARKQEQLINRFAQMELALQQIQNQSNWLAGQLNAADKAWQQA